MVLCKCQTTWFSLKHTILNVSILLCLVFLSLSLCQFTKLHLQTCSVYVKFIYNVICTDHPFYPFRLCSKPVKVSTATGYWSKDCESNSRIAACFEGPEMSAFLLPMLNVRREDAHSSLSLWDLRSCMFVVSNRLHIVMMCNPVISHLLKCWKSLSSTQVLSFLQHSCGLMCKVSAVETSLAWKHQPVTECEFKKWVFDHQGAMNSHSSCLFLILL